jgi:Calcineurin-like phosphoesterase
MVKYIILLASAWLITLNLPAQNNIIPFGSSWKYFDRGDNPGTSWQQPAFVDSAWKSGPAILGYGNKNEATLVSYGADATRKHITTYFRKGISIADVSRFSSFTANIKRDDGAVVYVNGVEVYRSNLPAGPITPNTPASVASDDGRIPQAFRIDAAAFRSGPNVLAVEIHQASPTNPDLAFDLELTGQTNDPGKDNTPPFVLRIHRQSPVIATTDAPALTWRIAFSEKVTGVDAADFTLTALSGPVSGSLAANAVAATDSSGTTYDVTVSAIAGEGTLRLNLKNAATNIADTAGNLLAGGYTRGQTYTLEQSRQGVLIPFSAAWEFLDNGSDQGTGWQQPAFADSAWKTGRAILGYGNKDISTVISFGSNPQKKYITSYFRKAIYLSDPSQFSSFTAKIKRDDGAVVYVNGVEVYRSNLPAGPITHKTMASVASDDGSILNSFLLRAGVFQTGINVIAVEIHQASLTNPDLAFALELTGTPASWPADRTPPAVLSIIRHEPAIQTSNATSVRFRVTSTEPVTGVDEQDFLLALSGTVSGKIEDLTPYGTHGTGYDILVQSIAGEGSLRLDLNAAGTGIADVAGNPINSGYTGGQSYTVQQAPAQVLLTRGPYLQMGSSTAVTLRWRTNKATDSRLEVGTSFGTYPLMVMDTTLSIDHKVRISGLAAGTRYYYRFGSASQVLQADTDNYFVTAPAANNPNKVRIAVFGDCGMNSNEIQSNALNAYRAHVGQNPADLLLLLGDNAYVDGTDAEYQANFFDAYSSTILKNHVLFPTPGNHDYHTTSQADRTAPYYNIFTLPTKGESGGVASGTEAYYSYDWGDIHFISLDSYGTESPDNSRLYDTLGAQVTWLKKDLAANTKPWVIAYWHHPPYSMGNHNSDKEEELILIRQQVLGILERNGVDLVLTGHSHTYERSYLLRNHTGKEASFNASLHTASSSSGRYDSPFPSCPFVTPPGKTNHGTVYVVSGSSGQTGKLQAAWPHNAMPFSDNEGGMLYLEVEQNRLDAKYLRTDGMVWDQFTIMKDVNKVTQVQTDSSGAVQLTASWIGSYLWSTGDSTRSIRVSPDRDTSSYQVTDHQNCLRDVFQVKQTTPKLIALRRGENRQTKENEGNQPWLYPTMVSRGTSLRVQAPSQKRLQAKVTDMTGRLIYETEFNGITRLETGGLPAGMYLVRLQGILYRKTLKFIVKE